MHTILLMFITQDGIYNQHNTYWCSLWICIYMVVSLTWLTVFLDIRIVCMIKINILQKTIGVSYYSWLLTLHAKDQASPSNLYRPSGDPYFLPKLSCIRRFLETLLSLTTKFTLTLSLLNASLTLSLLKVSLRPMSPWHIILWNHGLSQGSHVITIALFHAFHLWHPSFVLLWKILFSSHLYHMHTEIHEMLSSILIIFLSNMSPTDSNFTFSFSDMFHIGNRFRKHEISFSW